jgi:hypothetical protein
MTLDLTLLYLARSPTIKPTINFGTECDVDIDVPAVKLTEINACRLAPDWVSDYQYSYNIL